jgi:LacI family transcriptional regulator
MARHGLNVADQHIIHAQSNDPTGGYQGMRALLSGKDWPTAVLASDDAVAIGALKAAHDLGVSIPADISLVGFDDIDAAQYTIPALTTIRQSMEELARLGVETLYRLLNDEIDQGDAPVILVEPELIVRDSTAAPPDR